MSAPALPSPAGSAVLAWLARAGAGRDGRPSRLLAVACAALGALAATAAGGGDPLAARLAGAAGGVLLALAWGDARTGIIPHRIALPAIALACAASPGRGEEAWSGVAAAIAASAPLAVIHLVRPQWLGGGDVTMCALAGAAVGWAALPGASLLCCFGLTAQSAWAFARGAHPSDYVPWGPAIAAAAITAMAV